ncbi:YbaB/EbfC family nucleoid-associated protein [Nocardia sp. XZ_19_231]|uniref:YbaB/EbfC family nucleoid-associated protein n=1 Tax=Nocardia sp. XZ_19_231 TaxID=2769252 RepID=UPI00188F0BDC|nr:YbaB/EbfC family nucleoid-associated protein [Nocardia sp. XZ_19_231]
MTNEQARSDLHTVMDGVQEQLRTIARMQQERAQIVGTATVRKRVTVTVNADNQVIETKFAADIDDLDYAEIAKAVTEAAQQAAAEVARKTAELTSPLQAQRARMPRLSDMIDGMPELRIPQPVEASLAPPKARERAEQVGGEEPADRGRPNAATDSSW